MIQLTIISFILIAVIITAILAEISYYFHYCGNIIMKSGDDLIIKELENGGGLSDSYYEDRILFYDSVTILKIDSIKPIHSFVFSYIVSTNDYQIKYLVLRFSRSHYKIKEKYKYLNDNSNKIKPLKFK